MQTSVSDYTVGREGDRASGRPTDVVTRIVQDTNGDIKPGRFVTRGSADKTVVLPDATGEVSAAGLIQGASMYVKGREMGGTAGEFADGDPIPVMRKGEMWMIAEDAVADGGAVFARFVAGAGEELGRVRSDADGSDAVAVPGCFFRGTTTGVNQLVKVEINLP